MTIEPSCWFSVAASDSQRLPCAACRQLIAIDGVGDHHPSVCPACGVECVFLPWHGRITQILPDRAPAPLRQLIRWAQHSLDELDLAELLVAFEELAAALQPAEVVN